MFNIPFIVAEEYLYNGRIYRGKYPISVVDDTCETDSEVIPESSILEELDEDEIVKYNVQDIDSGLFMPFQTQRINKSKKDEYDKVIKEKNLNLFNNISKSVESNDSLLQRFQSEQAKERQKHFENKMRDFREKTKNKEIDKNRTGGVVKEKRKTDVNKEKSERIKEANKKERKNKKLNRKSKTIKFKNSEERKRQRNIAKKRNKQ